MLKRSGASAIRLKDKSRRNLTSHILRKFYLRILALVSILLAAYFLAWWALSSFIWYPDDALYSLFKVIQHTSPVWVTAIILTGILYISYKTLSEPLRYIDEVASASLKLISEDRSPITLSDELHDIEQRLNKVRTAAIANEEKAKEAEKRKNDLVVYLAHDLKTPLTSVIGYLSLLHDEPDLPETQRQKYIDIALAKAERLEDLTNEFFEITRFSLTAMEVYKEPLDLSRMIDQLTFEFAPAIKKKQLWFEIDKPAELMVEADPDKLGRVFDNLIRNAMNYSYPESGILIKAWKTDSQAFVTISNRARHIPKEKLERIFEQFYRLDQARRSDNGGSGLGLAIAREIVERHGGSLTAEALDEVIRFTLTLPLRPSGPAETGTA